MREGLHSIVSLLTLLVVAAVIADLWTHGTVTTALAKTFATLFARALEIASGQAVKGATTVS